MSLKIIYLFLHYILTKNIQKQIIKLNYRKKNQQLVHSFTFFYGNSKTGFKKIESEIDLYYDKTILISNKINKSGIDCIETNNCSQNDQSHFIVNNNQQLIETNLSYMPLYLDKKHSIQNNYNLVRLQFELANNNNLLNNNNIIGLNYNSNFLYYIGKLYGMKEVWFSLITETKANNKNEIMANPEDLDISLNFFEDIQERFFNSYFYQKTECLCLDNFSIDFSGIILNELPGKIDINLPYLMKVDPAIYSDFIKILKNIICKNVGECFKKEHVFPGYDSNMKLNIVFKSKETIMDNFEVKIFIKDMFYYDKDDFIQYNFDMNNKQGSKTIIFGILFLNKVDLLIYYEIISRRFVIYFKKKIKKKRYFIVEIILIGFFSAFFLTFLCLKLSTPKTDKFARNSFNSFLY